MRVRDKFPIFYDWNVGRTEGVEGNIEVNLQEYYLRDNTTRRFGRALAWFFITHDSSKYPFRRTGVQRKLKDHFLSRRPPQVVRQNRSTYPCVHSYRHRHLPHGYRTQHSKVGVPSGVRWSDTLVEGFSVLTPDFGDPSRHVLVFLIVENPTRGRTRYTHPWR